MDWEQNAKDVFALTLTHEEGKRAYAEITLSHTAFPLKHTRGAVCFKPIEKPAHVLFQGMVNAAETTKNGMLVTVRLEGLEEGIDGLKETLKGEADPLFSKGERIEDLIAAKPASLYWDRVTGHVKCSPLNDGTRNWIVDGTADELSFWMDPPVTTVNVTVNVQWIQHLRGTLNLIPMLRARFPGGEISTYTGSALKRSWPRPHTTQSGYAIVQSSLKEVNAPWTGIGRRAESAFFFKRKKRGQDNCARTEHVFAKKTWFDGELFVSWNMRQKREENLIFQLKSHVQPVTPAPPKPIFLRLQKIVQTEDLPFWHPHGSYKSGDRVRWAGSVYVARSDHMARPLFDEEKWEQDADAAGLCPSVRSSFFLTDRGYQAFSYALACAKVQLLREARCFFVKFSGSVHDLGTVTTDDIITVRDLRLPGKSVTGKVIRYVLHSDGASGKQRVTVTVAASLGASGEAKEYVPFAVPLYATDYAELAWQGLACGETSEGIVFDRYDDQRPTDAFADLMSLGVEDFVKGVVVENLPNVQEQKLIESHDVFWEGRESLAKCGTKIRIQFLPLGGKDKICHTIYPTIPSFVTPPQHVVLAQEKQHHDA